jgi:NADH:ubiquinone oxidoreductase subunit 2 (subunit N)
MVGMMFIAHSNSLLIMFLGIELMSIPFFVLAGFFRNNLSSIEASVKYFLLGAFATGFFVFGVAMIYGATGSLELNIISQKVIASQINPYYFSIGLGLMFVGLAFKSSTFPFHQWAPDVYTGAPTIVTSFMSTVGKTAAFVAFIIITKSLLPLISQTSEVMSISQKITQYSREILAVISAMIVGFILRLPLLPERPMRDSWTISIIFPTIIIALGLSAMVFELGWNGMIVGIVTGVLSALISKYLLEKILPPHTDLIGGESGE